jgi:DNA-binding MarR family transcriptional regulator
MTMAGKISKQSKQRRPGSLEEEAVLNVFRTAEVLNQGSEAFLKIYGLTRTQYNVLRILRGAGPEGMPCSQLGERMIARDPDITRLLDRMESGGFVERARSCKDRRIVNTRITSKALKLIGEMDQPLMELLNAKLGCLGKSGLSQLIDLLERTRNAWQ